jgi:lysyl-tRNA synthetase class 2
MSRHKEDWQPSASIEVLKQRAKILQLIRQFFLQRDVLEVDTPALGHGTVTDQHLHSFSTEFSHPMSTQPRTLYLQTSPEFAMKRLLCAGSGAIYQICKSFRNEESGRIHNPEFTMLEWYRPDYDHHQLMDEVEQLLQIVLACPQAQRVTYQQAFIAHLDCDPLTEDTRALEARAVELGYDHLLVQGIDKDTILMLLFSQHVEPFIGNSAPCFVYNFPASQAALAKINPDDPLVALRFECYFQGMELANGFYELSDSQEQLRRFTADNLKRQAKGIAPMPIDQHLIAALEHGLPDCAGVALGIDRLLMLALKQTSIDSVLAFANSRA